MMLELQKDELPTPIFQTEMAEDVSILLMSNDPQMRYLTNSLVMFGPCSVALGDCGSILVNIIFEFVRKYTVV